jgi:polysaccharide biosynthesis protein PslJ
MSSTAGASRPTSRIWIGAQSAIVPNRWETVSVLTTVLFLIMLIPERLVFKPLGAAGRPGVLLCVVCLLWWINVTLVRGLGRSGRSQIARIAITPFCMSVLISYVVAMSRPIDSIEVRSADRGLINLCAWAGVWLLTAEGIGDQDRLERLLKRLSYFGAVMAGIGIIQFLTGVDVSQWIVIPGLSANTDAESLLRNGLNRPASTTAHPIEFGVVMAMLIPLALHQLFYAKPEGVRWARIRLLLIATAAVMSLSRSAMLGLVVAGIMLTPNLPKERRRQLGWATLGFLVLMKFLAPGLIGTILQLFTGITSDDSSTSRTGSYAAVSSYIEQRPIFGRGFGTFLPSYHILDNQLLGTLIETGVVGLISLLFLLLVGAVRAWRTAKRVADPERRSLGISLATAAAIPAVSFATFDAFGFSVITILTFFIGGCCCAYVRMNPTPTKQEPAPSGNPATWSERPSIGQRSDQVAPQSSSDIEG